MKQNIQSWANQQTNWSYGTVNGTYSTDSADYFRIKTQKNENREVVIKAPKGWKISNGQLIGYRITDNVTLEGHFVFQAGSWSTINPNNQKGQMEAQHFLYEDFARGLYLNKQGQGLRTPVRPNGNLNLTQLERNLKSTDLSDVNAVAVYDPNPRIMDIFPYVIIAPDENRLFLTKDELSDLGFGSVWEEGNAVTHNTGFVGQAHSFGYEIDFRNSVRTNPKQAGVFFVPLEKLVEHQGIIQVPDENIIMACMDVVSRFLSV